MRSNEYSIYNYNYSNKEEKTEPLLPGKKQEG